MKPCGPVPQGFVVQKKRQKFGDKKKRCYLCQHFYYP